MARSARVALLANRPSRCGAPRFTRTDGRTGIVKIRFNPGGGYERLRRTMPDAFRFLSGGDEFTEPRLAAGRADGYMTADNPDISQGQGPVPRDAPDSEGPRDIAGYRFCGFDGEFMNGRQFVYHMEGLSKTYPGNRKVLENINLSFYPDAKIGVLGVNGSGKSTLLRIMAGIDKEYTGEGWVAEGARVGYLEQEPQLDAKKSVRENVMEGVAPQKAILDRYNELAANYSDEIAEEMAKLQDEIDSKNLWDLDSQVDLAMDALRCPPDDADVTKLSGGERRRVALCRLLLDQPDLLLLDEPTNHLDAESVNWLEGHLRQYPGAILIVTHDRYFLDNVTGWILELDHGRGIPYEGNYTSWLKQKQKRLEQEGREEEARKRALEAESEWIAASPKARQAKSKARIQRYEDLLAKQNDKAPSTAQIII